MIDIVSICKMKKILLIDDEPIMLRCLEAALSREGYELFATTESDKGFEILHNKNVSLVLLDIRMPEISGFDIYRELRKRNHMPVLFVTAYPRSFDVKTEPVRRMWQGPFADGTTDILYKPFGLNTLSKKVHGLIGSP